MFWRPCLLQLTRMKNLLLFVTLSLLFIWFSFAKQGCCSRHDGVAYCDNSAWRYVCNDGTYSPSCTCGGWYDFDTDYNYSTYTAPKSTYVNYYQITPTPVSEDEKCNDNYPWTVYRSTDNWCACPGDAVWTSSWDSASNSCEPIIKETTSYTSPEDNACDTRYPWTIYRASDQRCACPSDAKGVSTRNPHIKDCPDLSNKPYEKLANEEFVEEVKVVEEEIQRDDDFVCPPSSVFNNVTKYCDCNEWYLASDDGSRCIKEPKVNESYLNFTVIDVNRATDKCYENESITYQICYDTVIEKYQQMYDRQVCEKKSEGVRKGDACYCGEGTFLNEGTQTCEEKELYCGKYAYFDLDTSNCYCKEGYMPNESRTTCTLETA